MNAPTTTAPHQAAPPHPTRGEVWMTRLHWLSRHTRSRHAVGVTLAGVPVGAVISLALHAGSDRDALPGYATGGAVVGLVVAFLLVGMGHFAALTAAAGRTRGDVQRRVGGRWSWSSFMSIVAENTRTAQRRSAHDLDVVARWQALRSDVWAADHPDATGRQLLVARHDDLRAETRTRRGRLVFAQPSVPVTLAEEPSGARYVTYGVRARTQKVFAAGANQVMRDVMVTTVGVFAVLLVPLLVATIPLVQRSTVQQAGVPPHVVADILSYTRWSELVGVIVFGVIALAAVVVYAATPDRRRSTAPAVAACAVLAQFVWFFAALLTGTDIAFVLLA